MRQSIYLLSALLKIRLNLLTGRELLALSRSETKALSLNSPFESSWHLPPGAIRLRLSDAWPDRRRQLIQFIGEENLSPLDQHATFSFIRELVIDGKGYKETKLYAHGSGKPVQRQIEYDGKSQRMVLNDDEKFSIYEKKCRTLVESVSRRGLLPIEHVSDTGMVPHGGRDRNIGVAITADGQLAHFRRGHHRLAIGQVLGLEAVPVEIAYISGEYLSSRIEKRHLLSNRSTVSAINAVIAETVSANAGRQT